MTLAELLQFEKNLETLIQSVLQPACENVNRSRDSDTAKTPRIELKIITGELFNRQSLLLSDGQSWIYSSYLGELQVTVKTNRMSDTRTDDHSALLGQVRSRLQQFALVKWQNEQSAILPQLVFEIREAGNNESVVDTDDVDVTQLTYAIAFSINPKALPNNL